jgi:hypothetical protein
MKATLSFRLPDEQAEYDAARLGREALSTLQEIDRHCRGICKHGTPTMQERELAEAIRRMIPAELLET